MKKEKSAGAVVYYYDEERKEPIFLLLQNTLKKTYWEFPKGKIEENENIEQTILREIKEETGLKNIEIIPGFKHVLRWFFKFQGQLISKEAIYLLVKISEQEKDNVKISREHQKSEFMDIETARKEINIKANLNLLEKAYQFIKEIEKQKRLS